MADGLDVSQKQEWSDHRHVDAFTGPYHSSILTQIFMQEWMMLSTIEFFSANVHCQSRLPGCPTRNQTMP